MFQRLIRFAVLFAIGFVAPAAADVVNFAVAGKTAAAANYAERVKVEAGILTVDLNGLGDVLRGFPADDAPEIIVARPGYSPAADWERGVDVAAIADGVISLRPANLPLKGKRSGECDGQEYCLYHLTFRNGDAWFPGDVFAGSPWIHELREDGAVTAMGFLVRVYADGRVELRKS